MTVSATALVGPRRRLHLDYPSVCTAGGTNGTTITLLTAGHLHRGADQAGNATLQCRAPRCSQCFTVAKNDQTITFGASPTTLDPVAGDGRRDRVVGSRGGVHDHTPTVCTAGGTNGTTITLVSTGTCTVQADQAGNASFNAAPSVQRSFNVERRHPGAGRHGCQPELRSGDRWHVGHDHRIEPQRRDGRLVRRHRGRVFTVNSATSITLSRPRTPWDGRHHGHDTGNPRRSVAEQFTVVKLDQTITFAALGNKTLTTRPSPWARPRRRAFPSRSPPRRPRCAPWAAPTARPHTRQRRTLHRAGRPGR